jgi:hypothetical protein
LRVHCGDRLSCCRALAKSSTLCALLPASHCAVDDCLLFGDVSRWLCCSTKSLPQCAARSMQGTIATNSMHLTLTRAATRPHQTKFPRPVQLQRTSCAGANVACTLRAPWCCEASSPPMPPSLPQVEPYPSAKHCDASLILHMQPLAAGQALRAHHCPPTREKDLRCTPLLGLCCARDT